MVVNTAFDMKPIGKIAFDKAELSSKQVAYSVVEAVKVNPESISWFSKAEVSDIRLAHEILLYPLKMSYFITIVLLGNLFEEPFVRTISALTVNGRHEDVEYPE